MTACLLASAVITTTIGIPHAPALHPPPLLPAYATQQVIYHMAGIVAGETVPDCEICHLWIACTVRRDIEDGRHPWALHPERWHGYRTPSPAHLAAVEAALHLQGCLSVPTCAYLGNLNDYRYWSAGRLAQDVSCHLVGNHHGAIVCVPPADPATPSPAPSTAATANTPLRRPASLAPARPRRSGHVCE